MSARPFDPALWLSAGVACCLVAASVVVQGSLVERDRNQRRDATEAVAAEGAARLEGRLDMVLSTLETATAGGLSNLDQRTASLRTSGALTAVAVVGADGHSSRILIGAASPPLGPAVGPTLEAARDVGQARLSGLAGPEALIAVAPIYRGAPRGTAERRSLLDGYVVASVDLAELLGKSVPRPAGTAARLTDDAGAAGPQGPPAGPGPVATRSVEGGGNTYVLTVTGAPAPCRLPVLPVGAGVLAVPVLGAAARTVRGRRTAERAASVRSEELSLLANLGALLQQSLDLEVILPAVALRLSEQLELDGCAVLRADRRGRLVQAFALGAPPASELPVVSQIVPPPAGISPDEEALLPLQRAGRVTGALWLRPRRTLDGPTVRTLHAVADLLAAGLANADAYDQERETVRRLEELDRIKNRFIGTVSHEMRTSASAISGFAGLLSSRWNLLDEEERQDLVVRVARNAQSLVSIVEDFLDFSRLERRSPASEPPPASLSDLAATAADDLAPMASSHRLVTRIAPDVGALVDRAAVERILANLVSNAVKYSPPGSTVTVTVDADGDAAVLAVEDEGPGIPPAERERVFDAFYRVSHVSVAGTHGAGIGLAVVKEVADRVRARVSAGDSPSGGARLAVAFRGAHLSARTPEITTGGSHGH